MPPPRLVLEAFKLLCGSWVEVEAREKVAAAPGWYATVGPAALQPPVLPQRGLGASLPVLGVQAESAPTPPSREQG